MGALTIAQTQYMDYVRKVAPEVYSIAIKQANQDTGATLGDLDWGSMFSSFTSAVSQVAPQILQLKQQRDMLKIQTDRAKKGLPPISNTADYNSQLPVEATQGYGAYNIETRIAGIPLKYILIGGAALIAVFMFTKMRK